jgi:hypothetical protein
MSYYMGDYYGYGRAGDPGFFGALGGLVKGAVGGFVTGGPWGAVAGGVLGAIGGASGAPKAATNAAAAATEQTVTHLPVTATSAAEGVGYTLGRVARPAIGLVRSRPGLVGAAAGVAGLAGTELLMHHPAAAAARARGMHMSKPYKCHGVVVPSHPVRNRRMNVCNPRALRRAARRAHGFLRISRKLVGHYVAKHPKGRAYIKVGKRRK